MDYNYFWVTRSEARQLVPVLQKLRKEGPWKEARESAFRLLNDLEYIARRPGEGTTSRGYQMVLSDTDYGFLLDIMNVYSIR